MGLGTAVESSMEEGETVRNVCDFFYNLLESSSLTLLADSKPDLRIQINENLDKRITLVSAYICCFIQIL